MPPLDGDADRAALGRAFVKAIAENTSEMKRLRVAIERNGKKIDDNSDLLDALTQLVRGAVGMGNIAKGLSGVVGSFLRRRG